MSNRKRQTNYRKYASRVLMYTAFILLMALPFLRSFLRNPEINNEECIKIVQWGLWGFSVIFFIISACLDEVPLGLRIDRMLVGDSRSEKNFFRFLSQFRPIEFYIFICLFLFDFFLCTTPSSRSRIFADMVSSETLRTAAYSNRDDTSDIEVEIFVGDSSSTDIYNTNVVVNPVENSNNKYNQIYAQGKKTFDKWNYIQLTILYLFGSVFIMGLFIASVKQVFDSRVTKYKDGLTTYGKFKKHYVILGYGEIALPIIESIDKTDSDAFIVLLTEQNVHHLRPLLEERKSNNRILVYSGDIELESNLKRLKLDKAAKVYILGEGKEKSRDAKNIALLSKIQKIRMAASDSLDVFVQLDKPSSYATVKRLSLDTYTKGKKTTVLNIRPFNYYENCARQLWGYWGESNMSNHSLDKSVLDSDSKKHVRIVIAGFGPMGQALLLEALNVCHFPNCAAHPNDLSLKTRICVIDPEMNRLKPLFQAQYSELSRILDVDIEYRNGLLEDAAMRDDIVRWATDENILLTIAVCLPDSDQSLSSALSLPEEAYFRMVDNKPKPACNIQILTNQEVFIKDMNAIISNERCKIYENVHTFGFTAHGWDDNIMSDVMPIWINYFYSNDQIRDEAKTILDENDVAKYRDKFEKAEKEWGKLNEDLKYSNRYQVDMYGIYERYKGMSNVSPETLMRMEHARWMADRAIMSYKYNEENIKEYKLHHCMIAFDKLQPETEKKKDEQVISNLELVQRLYNFHHAHIIDSFKPAC